MENYNKIRRKVFKNTVTGRLLISVEHFFVYLIAQISILLIPILLGIKEAHYLLSKKTMFIVIAMIISSILFGLFIWVTNSCFKNIKSLFFWWFYPLSEKQEEKIYRAMLKEIEMLEKKSKERIEDLQKEMRAPCPHLDEVKKINKELEKLSNQKLFD